MFDARIASADDKTPPVSIRVEDYERAAHRGHTLCGDFNCQARVYYRRETRTHGDVALRVPHFATMPGDTHIDGCTHHNPDSETRALRSLEIALAAGQKILINLNINVGLSAGDDFGPAADPHAGNTPYARFMRAGGYFAVSANSANDLLRYRAALLRSGAPDAMARTYVGHRHELRKFENVFIGEDKKKLRTLFNTLALGDGVMQQGPQQTMTGFPRLFQFTPTKKTRDDGGRSGKINGTSQCISNAGEPGVILLQNLGLRDPGLRRDILENGATYVLAAPTISRGAVRKDDRGTSFVTMNWQIFSEGQYAAVPRAP